MLVLLISSCSVHTWSTPDRRQYSTEESCLELQAQDDSVEGGCVDNPSCCLVLHALPSLHHRLRHGAALVLVAFLNLEFWNTSILFAITLSCSHSFKSHNLVRRQMGWQLTEITFKVEHETRKQASRSLRAQRNHRFNEISFLSVVMRVITSNIAR